MNVREWDGTGSRLERDMTGRKECWSETMTKKNVADKRHDGQEMNGIKTVIEHVEFLALRLTVNCNVIYRVVHKFCNNTSTVNSQR